MPPSCARRQSHATKGAVSSLNRLADIPRARGCGARPYPSRHGCEPDDRGGGVPSQRCWPCKREQGVALPCRHVDQASSWDWAHPATSAPGVHQPGGRTIRSPLCPPVCASRRPSATRAMCAWLSHGSSIARAACSNPITNALSAEVVVDYWTRTTSKRQVSISAILPGACLLPARAHARTPLLQSTRSAPVGADRGFTRPLHPSSQRNACGCGGLNCFCDAAAWDAVLLHDDELGRRECLVPYTEQTAEPRARLARVRFTA